MKYLNKLAVLALSVAILSSSSSFATGPANRNVGSGYRMGDAYMAFKNQQQKQPQRPSYALYTTIAAVIAAGAAAGYYYLNADADKTEQKNSK
jgi:hypothetical protein